MLHIALVKAVKWTRLSAPSIKRSATTQLAAGRVANYSSLNGSNCNYIALDYLRTINNKNSNSQIYTAPFAVRFQGASETTHYTMGCRPLWPVGTYVHACEFKTELVLGVFTYSKTQGTKKKKKKGNPGLQTLLACRDCWRKCARQTAWMCTVWRQLQKWRRDFVV